MCFCCLPQRTWKGGRDRFWRKNMRLFASDFCMGVDLNRNFDFHWKTSTVSTKEHLRRSITAHTAHRTSATWYVQRTCTVCRGAASALVHDKLGRRYCCNWSTISD